MFGSGSGQLYLGVKVSGITMLSILGSVSTTLVHSIR
ncbi:hypothetical protein SLEP1_g24146 [Rubroshorea leprosula]|uniref:Uncharacterized protein n=1 Tax=Rubroshorea leprosula TaxID=152421 RepID=A0AAV5JNW3_9ROSI|nr:hypothetical protein SLEP1_g24146 [Rubroshorea leprosula]